MHTLDIAISLLPFLLMTIVSVGGFLFTYCLRIKEENGS